jgi:hypothetical protein
MGFLRRWLGGSDVRPDGTASTEGSGDEAEWRVAHEATFDAYADRQRVTVWLRLLDAEFANEREQQRIYGLENRVMRALDGSGAGEHDTNALETGFFAMRLIGDDADAIVSVILPLLSDAPQGSYLALRRGPAGTGEDRMNLGDNDDPSGPRGG